MLKGKLNVNLEALEALFKPKTPPLIGTDISTSAVKLVELSEAGKGVYRVERYAVEPLPKESVVDGNINNLDAVSEALKRCHKRLGSGIKNVAMALPSAAVITKKILVPAGQPEEDLELQVETEANQYIPFALDEVNLDFHVLGPAPASPEDVEVLIAASRKEKIEDRIAAAEVAGLKAVVMDVDIFASQAAIPHMKEAGGGSIIHDASNAGLVGRPWQSVYGATKAGIISLSKSMALSLARDNVRVNCICPGSIATPMLRGALASSGDFDGNWRKTELVIPMGRIGKSEDIANATLFLASDEASYVTGIALPVDGGRTAGVAETAHLDMGKAK